VVWVLASQASSFKMGECARPLGTLVNDRQAGVVVDAGRTAPVLPVTLDIEGVPGAPHKKWSFTITHDKFLSPTFIALAVGSAIEATTSERRDVTWRATTEVVVTGYGPLVLEDAGVAVGGTPDVDDWIRSRAVRSVGAILNNPWEPARIERVTTTIRVKFARELYRLRGAQALSDFVEAGQKARIRLDLEPFAGPMEHKIVELLIPRELAGKEIDIDFDPGYRESPELPAPERVADLLANLARQNYPLDSIVASIRLFEQGVSMHGQVAERLPRGALDALRPLHDTASPEPFVSYLRTAIPIHRFLEGKDKVHLSVRPVLR
jgi:hypothetical protein